MSQPFAAAPGLSIFLDNELLFAGDHVLPTITPSIGFESAMRANPLGAFLQSLALVRARPDARLLPALSDACVACREAAAHRGVVLEFEVCHEDFLLSPLCLP